MTHATLAAELEPTSMAGAATNARWIRLPSKGRCPHTGLSRAWYYSAIARGQIKSACIRRPGALTGIRLIWLPSVLALIERNVVSDPARAEGGAL